MELAIMKRSIKIAFSFLLFLIGLSLVTPTSRTSAQAFRVIHYFKGPSSPSSVLATESNVYGTAASVFKATTDGTGYTNIHVFKGTDGSNPYGGLLLLDNTVYGTTIYGATPGINGIGTIFAVNTDGTGFTNLHFFSYNEGVSPFCRLTTDGGKLYGTSQDSGPFGYGTVFSLNLDGSSFSVLHSFQWNEGCSPNRGLILVGNTLYGVTPGGGNQGSVFSIHTDGSAFTLLHTFSSRSGSFPFTNADGALPLSVLVSSGERLYGTAASGGENGNGTIFSLNLDGTGFSSLHHFSSTRPLGSSDWYYTNYDGANPECGLILSNNTLYGTTRLGGTSASGTLFAIKADGSDFKTLHSFDMAYPPHALLPTNIDGSYPSAQLSLVGTTLYGCAAAGGTSGLGTLFSISFAPELTVTQSVAGLVLMWPTNFAGFDYSGFTLQSTTNLTPAVWITNLPAPIVVNGQYLVTNPISGQQFFRLSQP